MESTASIKTLITHQANTQNEFPGIQEFEEQLKAKSDHFLPLQEELSLLQQLTEFELGRYLLLNKGLNGFWTQYIHSPIKDNIHPLEKWIITRSPGVRATRERFQIFHTQIQKYVKSNRVLASIPCGLMDDLLTLDLTGYTNINLVGIDLDHESLHLASQNALDKGIKNAKFIERTAWELHVSQEFDLITSNGLNIYVKDSAQECALYKEFYKALKPGGIFITSFLTPPPMVAENSSWKNYSAADLLKQKAIFTDILQAGWQEFQTEECIKTKLQAVGFKVLEVINDTSAIMPTIVCRT